MDKVALVTGGSRGIGAGISISLKEAGYTVVASYVSDQDAAGKFSEKTGIPIYQWDVGDFDACQRMVADIETRIGPIAILVNNAGITRDTTMHKMDHDCWQSVIDTDLGSCFNMCRAVIEGMRERRFGRIINVGSINGQAGQFGQTNYSAAKAGILGFTKALAQEVASRGITVNTIAPGYVATDMVKAVPQKALDKIVAEIPTGRLGEPEDISRGVAFLAADEAGFITGSTLTINGGQYMC